ncbi:N-6 DNA methylase [Ruminococcus bicirculans (ex Wegman et al. 2014)]|uniref:N-6 DNA methylase n=1 Tax=Ruminococcus bicirculans (ex Wegman et al. 2014) TaxID=1160721 RepID=UPI0039950D44
MDLKTIRIKRIIPRSFDILVANPPYSVKAFKPHLKLTNNQLNILDKISNDGSEIETLFVERISQLLKPNGVAAVILPSSILNKENESFVTARESLLKNFNIIAIATLGSKTFGATGTNTVILFLQKFNEPPKRTDMVIDSVDAILSKADIDGWEDESILRGYLKKIGVKKDIYNKFLSKSEDFDFWINDNYFGQHYNEFVNSTEYNKKSKQKTFQKLSDSEKKKWFTQRFYEYAFSVEQEKLFYYSLVYNQDTLIISAPDENKEQEKFLGYKWSNRKGQEGIQIIKAGGCLYNVSNRRDNNSIAGLIRNAFSDEDEFDVKELDSYYYRLRLQDMLDFSGTAFNKSIKTTPTRVLKDIPGLTNYRLSDKNIFELSIGNRVLSDEVVENGSIPIYSANVFEEFGRIDKQNITDFSVPSILWGIDGDWMVNIIPANKPFYPTDHCGVLRIKTDDIIPKYMALALQAEGEFERFSRSNRASTQRISNLVIQIPSVADQQKVVDAIEAIDKKIADEQAIISEQSEKVKSKFAEMFGNIEDRTKLALVAPLYTGRADIDMLSIDSYITTDNMLQNKRGIIPYMGTLENIAGAVEYHCNDILVSNIRPYLKKIWLSDRDGGCSTDILVFRIKDTSKFLPVYVYYTLYQDTFFDFMMEGKKGLKMPRGDKNLIQNYLIPNANIDLQKDFVLYVNSCDKLKFEAQKKLGELNTAREELIDKYFR